MARKIYKEEDLRTEGMRYFKGDMLATNVWIKKYALKINGKFVELSPDDTIRRMAHEIHRAELKFPNPLSWKEIYKNLKGYKNFIFAGSIQFGLGNPIKVSLGNCFFIDNGADSYGGIFQTDEAMAQLMKRRGGVGITIEHLRPSGAVVRNSAQSSTGAISFMERFSNTTREVAQDGRRGALMISMHVNHPDIKKFIHIKDDLTKVTGANISVKMTDEFMKAAEADQDYYLRWPVDYKLPENVPNIAYDELYEVEPNKYIKRVKANDIWMDIVTMAHKNAEPGVLFWDRIISESPADMYAKYGFTTKGTNPCGEVPLSPFDSCRLGSINIFAMIRNAFKPNAAINWTKLEEVARFGQRVMDDIVTLEEERVMEIIEKIQNDPEPEEVKRTELFVWQSVLGVLRKGRRTGLGILGLGDAFAALGIKYGTPESTKIAEKIMKTIAVASYKESIQMAEERGAFPLWDADVEAGNPFLMRVISDNLSTAEYEQYLKYGRRNIADLSIAPTGSLAIVGQTTSSKEPVFKIYYRRRRKVNPGEEGIEIAFVDQNGDSWEEYNVIHPTFINWYTTEFRKVLTYEAAYDELKNMAEGDLDAIVAQSPWAGSEAHTIDYIEKVNMQGAIQKWVDHSISVTHNLPENITVKETNDIYFQGWKAGCKGLTIYREGSRSGVLISKKEEGSDEFPETMAPKRPKELPSDYYVATSRGVKYAVIVGLYKDKPYEIFAFENPPSLKNTKGKTVKVKKGHYRFINGEFEIDQIELAADREHERTVTLMASGLLRHGAPIPYINKTITKIDENITSFSSVVRRYLSRYIEEVQEIDGESCPHCGDKLITESGCIRCVNPECGYERCG